MNTPKPTDAFSGLNDARLLVVPDTLPRYTLSDLPARLGQVLGTSPWIVMDQPRIDAFAHTTIDPQWIHVDTARAAAGPFGATVAHGFLTLSMLPWMSERAFVMDGLRMTLNYGLDRVRFPAAVLEGQRLRGVFKLLACDWVEDGGAAQLKVEACVEREGEDKPACVAVLLSRRYPQP